MSNRRDGMRVRGIALLLCALLCLSFSMLTAPSAESTIDAEEGSLNLESTMDVEEGSLRIESIADGVIDFEGDSEYTDVVAAPVRKLRAASSGLPSKYTNTRVTDVLNQGATSLCWAYSALDGGQIGIMKNRSDVSAAAAFSAGHLGYASYHGGLETWSSSSGTSWYSIGGNGQIASSTLLRWYGAAPFADYPSTSALTISADKLTESRSHLLEYRKLPSPASMSTEAERERAVTAIKQAVLEYGAVSIDYYFKKGSSYYNATNSIYTSEKTAINHESVIIGWNDEQKTAASKDGAFLVKNSYGADFGDDGAAWLSYEDMSMSNPYVFIFENTVSGEHKDTDLYCYDGIGYWVYLKKGNQAIETANVFTAARDEIIDSVGFYIPEGGSYSVKVRTNLKDGNPGSGTTVASLSGTVTYFGFYRFELPSPVSVKKSSDFAVCVSTTQGSTGWMYFEGSSRSVGKLNRTTRCEDGTTYLRASNGDYVDILKYSFSSETSGANYGNACIKAYGNPADGKDDKNGPDSAAIGLELREKNNAGGSGSDTEGDDIEIVDGEINTTPDSDDGKTTPSKDTQNQSSSSAQDSASGGQGAADSSKSASSKTSTYVTIYKGVDYAAVYDFKYYMKKYPSLKKKYGSDPSGALRYFVKYGMKKMHRASKSFDVKSYVNEYSALRRKYKTNWKKYYLHYINVGKSAGWHGTGCSKMKNPLTKYKGKNYKKIYNFNYYISRYPAIKKKYQYDDYGALKYFVTKGRKAGQKAKK